MGSGEARSSISGRKIKMKVKKSKQDVEVGLITSFHALKAQIEMCTV